METSFDSSGHKKIGCCGVSCSNKSVIFQNECPEKEVEGEIGHLPGQKWPHVICRQNSRIQCQVKVLKVHCYEYYWGRHNQNFRFLNFIINLKFHFHASIESRSTALERK